MERLMLDTGALIAIERGHLSADDVLPDDADLAMSAVTASELLVGVEHADPVRRPLRATMVEGMIARIQVIAFDLAVARHHAVLAAAAARQGRTRGAHDLQIAASARATGRTLVTTDTRAFEELPGVTWRSIG